MVRIQTASWNYTNISTVCQKHPVYVFIVFDTIKCAMWPQRIQKRIDEHTGAVALFENYEGGGKFVSQYLRERGAVAWFELPPGVREETRLGDLLATTINEALGAAEPFIGTGVSYKYGIKQFLPYTKIPGSFYLIVGNAEQNPSFARAILDLQGAGCKVVLIFQQFDPSIELPEGVCSLHHHELRLTRDEVLLLDRGFISEKERQTVWNEFAGRPLQTKARIAEIQGLKVVVPNPTPYFEHFPAETNPHLVLNKLVATKEYQHAFFFAARYCPELLPKILDKAGFEFTRVGGLSQMFTILNAVEPPFRINDAFILWLVLSAHLHSDILTISDEVIRYCEKYDHPDALTLVVERSPDMNLTQRKSLFARAQSSPKRGFYTYLRSRMLEYDLEQRHLWITHAFNLAKEQDEPTLILEAVVDLTLFALETGDFVNARLHNQLAWAVWGQLKGTNEMTRIILLNATSYVSVLLGDAHSSFDQLADLPLEQLPETYMALESLVLSTRIEILLFQAKTSEAVTLARYAVNRTQMKHSMSWRLAELLALSLCQQERQNEALEALQVASHAALDPRAHTRLQYIAAISEANSNPEIALAKTEAYFADPDQAFYVTFESVGMAVLHLYLVEQNTGNLDLERIPKSILELVDRISIQAFRIFIAPFDRYKDFITRLKLRLKQKDQDGLNLKVLHSPPQATLNGKSLNLSLREFEALFILVTCNKSLSYPELHSLLYPEGKASPGTVRKLVFKLRQHIPITSNLILGVPTQTDYAAVCDWLKRVDNAPPPSAYPTLLPNSEAPFVEQLRTELDEDLRQRLFCKNEIDFAAGLAAELDDLELLEHLHKHLPQTDKRYGFISTRIKRIQAEYE